MVNWKIIGIITTVAGAGLSMLSSVVEDKKMEKTIEDKVREALSREDEES